MVGSVERVPFETVHEFEHTVVEDIEELNRIPACFREQKDLAIKLGVVARG